MSLPPTHTLRRRSACMNMNYSEPPPLDEMERVYVELLQRHGGHLHMVTDVNRKVWQKVTCDTSTGAEGEGHRWMDGRMGGWMGDREIQTRGGEGMV